MYVKVYLTFYPITDTCRFIVDVQAVVPWFRAKDIFIMNQMVFDEDSSAKNNVHTLHITQFGKVRQQLKLYTVLQN